MENKSRTVMSGWERWLMKNWPQKLTRKRKGEDKSFKSSFILKYKLVATDSSSVKKQENKNEWKAERKRGSRCSCMTVMSGLISWQLKADHTITRYFNFHWNKTLRKVGCHFCGSVGHNERGGLRFTSDTLRRRRLKSPVLIAPVVQPKIFFFFFCSSEPSHRNSHAEHSATHRCFLRPAQLINIICCVYIDPPPPLFFLSQPTPTASFQRERKEKKNRNQEREVNVHLTE